MQTKPTKPDWIYLLAVWGPITAIAGLQGWLTGDTVMLVLHWFGH